MNELITIVVPVYNVEKYLEACVKSLISQTYQNLQIILVDDGSTDSSGDLCDMYCDIYPNIEVIHKINGGLSSARNIGIKYAHGKYITFVDSDDYLDRDMIAVLYKYMMEYHTDIASCDYYICDENRNENVISTKTDVSVIAGDKQIEALFLKDGISTTAWGKLYSISLFDGVLYPEGRYHEDIFTTYKLIDKSKSTVIVNKKMYAYRQVHGSITHTAFGEKHYDCVIGTKERVFFIEKKYPIYKKLAYAEYVHCCCKCLFKIFSTGKDFSTYESELHDEIKKYLKYLLCSRNYRLKVKVMAVTAMISMKLCKKIVARLDTEKV